MINNRGLTSLALICVTVIPLCGMQNLPEISIFPHEKQNTANQKRISFNEDLELSAENNACSLRESDVSNHNAKELLSYFNHQQQSRIQRPHSSIAFSPNKQLIAYGCSNGLIIIVNACNYQIIAYLGAHHHPVTALCFSSDNHYLVSSGSGEKIAVWDVHNITVERQPVVRLNGQHGKQLLSFSPDSRYLAAVSTERRNPKILVWNTADFNQKSPRAIMLHHNECPTQLSFSPDSRCLFIGCSNKKVQCWFLTPQVDGLGYFTWDFDVDPNIPEEVAVQGLCFVNTGHLVTGLASGKIHLWDVEFLLSRQGPGVLNYPRLIANHRIPGELTALYPLGNSNYLGVSSDEEPPPARTSLHIVSLYNSGDLLLSFSSLLDPQS